MLIAALFSVLSLTLGVQCAVSYNFVASNFAMEQAEAQPLLAVLRLVAAVSPSLKDTCPLNTAMSSEELNVFKAVSALQTGDVQNFDKLNQIVFEQLNEYKYYPNILFNAASRCLEKYVTRVPLADTECVDDALNTINPVWKLLETSSTDHILISCRDTKEMRRYLPINDKRYRLSHAITRLNCKPLLDSHALLQYDLDLNQVTAQYSFQKRDESIGEGEGLDLMPKNHQPEILVYVLDGDEPQRLFDLPNPVIGTLNYSLRASLQVLAFLLPDSDKLYSDNVVVSMLQRINSKTPEDDFDGAYLRKLKEIEKLVGKTETIFDLLRLLPKEFVDSNFSQIKLRQDLICSLCGNSHSTSDTNYMLEVPSTVEKLSDKLTKLAVSTRQTNESARCSKCSRMCSQKKFVSITTKFSRYLLVKVGNPNTENAVTDVPLVDLKIGGKTLQRLVSAIDHNDTVWLWLDETFWVTIRGDCMDIVRVKSNVVPFAHPQLLVYRA